MTSPIQIFLDRHNLDGFLFVGDSICDADMYYLTHFLAGDRFAALAQEKTTLLVSSMEMGRAEKESVADKCLSTSQYQIREKLKRSENWEEAYGLVLADFLRDHSILRLGVPFRFPAGLYQHLIQDFDVTDPGEPRLTLSRGKDGRRAKRHCRHTEGLRESHAPGDSSYRQLRAPWGIALSRRYASYLGKGAQCN